MTFLKLLLLLCAGHALCDYPLQGDFLAKFKNRHEQRPFACGPWWQSMSAHCLIHMGMVLVITGSVWMALAEFLIHFATDYTKNGRPDLAERSITFNQDQAVHFACKVLWAAIAAVQLV